MPVDVIEYQFLASDSLGNVIPTGREPAAVVQTPVAIGGVSTQSAAFGSNTRLVRLHTDAACRVAFGENPTATANSMRLAANSTEFFGVIPGQKVAVITST